MVAICLLVFEAELCGLWAGVAVDEGKNPKIRDTTAVYIHLDGHVNDDLALITGRLQRRVTRLPGDLRRFIPSSFPLNRGSGAARTRCFGAHAHGMIAHHPPARRGGRSLAVDQPAPMTRLGQGSA
jgi:hypothetical protein